MWIVKGLGDLVTSTSNDPVFDVMFDVVWERDPLNQHYARCGGGGIA